MGRLGFDVLLREGLQPGSRVLDVGCGALRLGYWLMRFLNAGCYHGIEPNTGMLNLGLERLVEHDVVERAHAQFSDNDQFDFSVFGERLDFVYARSIWTHASKGQIGAMLDSFARNSAPGALFLASYYPASPLFKAANRWPRVHRPMARLPLRTLSPGLAKLPSFGLASEYRGDTWAGRSHQTDEPGVARHSLRWIAAEAAEHGLCATLLPYPIVNGQYWASITAPR